MSLDLHHAAASCPLSMHQLLPVSNQTKHTSGTYCIHNHHRHQHHAITIIIIIIIITIVSFLQNAPGLWINGKALSTLSTCIWSCFEDGVTLKMHQSSSTFLNSPAGQFKERKAFKSDIFNPINDLLHKNHPFACGGVYFTTAPTVGYNM